MSPRETVPKKAIITGSRVRPSWWSTTIRRTRAITAIPSGAISMVISAWMPWLSTIEWIMARGKWPPRVFRWHKTGRNFLMQRRDFSKLVGTGIALPALSQVAGQAPKRIKTALITGAGGAHLNYYCESLALAEEVASVSFCDPSGESNALARKLLGNKLASSYPDLASLFRKEKPDLALISMEAAASPPAIDAALDAGCHVLAEKPGCVHVEDFEKLNRKAKAHNRQLLLALGNRVDPA